MAIGLIGLVESRELSLRVRRRIPGL